LYQQFFDFISCISVAKYIVAGSDKSKLNQLELNAATLFRSFIKDDGRLLLNCGVPIFKNCIDNNDITEGGISMPSLPKGLIFGLLSKANEIVDKAGGKKAKTSLSTEDANNHQALGKVAYEAYSDAKSLIDKSYNSLWRPLKSGESKAGLLRTIRETLWEIDVRKKLKESITRKHKMETYGIIKKDNSKENKQRKIFKYKFL
jgi:hypothetical protein